MAHTKNGRPIGGRTLLSVAVAMALAVGASPAMAQEEEEEEPVEEVVVTGSRIQRAAYDNLQPGVAVDSDYMDGRGYVNVAEAINEVPAFGLPVNESGRQDSQSLGQNFANAFGLGTQRTLTLINGRRVVSQASPALGGVAAIESGLQVDLNMIPTIMIDRVETIFVGGAPIYGTDAIAGTVNLILKDDFEGIMFDAQTQQDERGDAENVRLRGLWGANSADGKGNVMLGLEFASTQPTLVTDNDLASRGTAHCENPAGGTTGFGAPLLVPDDGIPDTIICDDAFGVWQVPTSGMPLASLGLVTATGANSIRDAQGNPLMFDADGSLITWEQAGLGSPRGPFFSVGSDAINNPLFVGLSETNNLIAELDRYIINATGHREIAPGIRLFGEALYARSESADRSPDATFGTVVFGPGANGVAQVNIAENPFVTPQIRNTLIDNGLFDPNLADDQYLLISRSNLDIGANSPDFRDQDVFRLVVGMDGTLPIMGNDWDWNVAFNIGETNATSRQTDINGRRLALAIDSVVDPNTNEIVCRSQIEPLPNVFPPSFREPVSTDVIDCVPFNPIGIQNLTAEQQRYLLQQDFQSTNISQTTYEVNLAGDLFELPAGPVAVAGGFMRREESSEYNVDRSSAVGFDPITPVSGVAGGYDTNEFYVETLVPVIEEDSGFDVPGISSLQIEGAIRWVDNTLAGNDTTWTLGGRLRPDLPGLGDSITIRGNVTTSIRAPSVQELFLPRSEFNAFAEDPCDDEFSTAGPNPEIRQANCAAEVASRIQQGVLDPNFQLAGFVSLAANRGFPQFTGGNQDLESEEADSWTVGIVFSPEFVPGLTLSADWTDISIKNEIARLNATQIMNACYDSPNFPNLNECTLFERDFDFQVVAPQTGFLNAASRDFAGLIANFNYDLADTWVAEKVPGNLEVFGSMFHVAKHTRNVTGSSTDILEGERGFEEWRSQLNVRWTNNDLGALWQARFIGEFLADAQAPTERFSPGQNGAGSTWLHNATLTYRLTERLGVRLVVNNVFDNRDSARRRAQTLGGTSTLPFSPLDVIGRRYALAISGEF